MQRYMMLIVVSVFALLVFLPAEGKAQADCRHILEDSTSQGWRPKVFPDSGLVLAVEGKRGDTVQVPVSLVNTRNAGAFQFFLEVDTTWLKPVVTGSSAFTDTLTGETLSVALDFAMNPAARMSIVLEGLDRDLFTAGSDNSYRSSDPNRVRIKVLAASFDLNANREDIIAAIGRGPVVTLPMVIDSIGQQDDQTTIRWYYEDILDSTAGDFPVPIGCQFSQYSDTLGTYRGTLTTVPGIVRIDSLASDAPQITNFAANPTTIQSGQSSTLSWSVINATSVSISPGIGDVGLSGTASVSPSTTTTYTITASNESTSIATRSVTVTVQGSSSNNSPVVESIVPNAYTITQGENVSFSVSASDADGDFITLEAVNLPSNATFGTGGQVTGTGSASGNFSFTPNTTQDGTYVVGFRASDNQGGVSGTVNVSITVEAIEFDILFSKSRKGGSPVGGLAGKPSVLFPIDLVTSQTVYGVQFDFFYDDQYFEIDSIMTSGRTPEWVIYDNIGQTPGEIRIVSFGMENQPVQTDTTDNTTILWVAMTIDSTAEWGDYPIYLENGWESNNPDPEFPSLPLLTDSAIIQVDRNGDVNLDQRIDVADAVSTTASILGNITLTERQSDAGDVIIDQAIDVFDLVGIINLIYGYPVDQQNAPSSGGDELFATVSLDYDDMFVGDRDELVVHSELPEDIAGVELNLQYDARAVRLGKPVKAPDAEGLQLIYKDDGGGNMKVLMHFTNPANQTQLIRRGLADLVSVPMFALEDVEHGNTGQLRLTEVKLSTAAAKSVKVEGHEPPLPTSFALLQNYPNPFNPTTTIEFSIAGQGEHVTLDIYNVLGQQVRNLVDKALGAGHYTVEWDATTDHGRKVATGVYLYRLQVGPRAETKKMLLLK